MTASGYERVCYRTEQQDEHVPLYNVRNGQLGYSFGCTHEGTTVQVRLVNGELDSWSREECDEAFMEPLC